MTASDYTCDKLKQIKNVIKPFCALNYKTTEAKHKIFDENGFKSKALCEVFFRSHDLIDEPDFNERRGLLNFNASFLPTSSLKYSNMEAIPHNL